MAKVGSKLKTPSQNIIFSMVIIIGLILASAYFFDGLRIGKLIIDPSALTNAITLFGFAFIPLVELYYKKPRFQLKLRTPADRAVAAIVLPISSASILMAFLIGFEVSLPTAFRVLIALLFIMNSLFTVLLSRT